MHEAGTLLGTTGAPADATSAEIEPRSSRDRAEIERPGARSADGALLLSHSELEGSADGAVLLSHSELEGALATETAARLTAVAFGISEHCFVAPSDVGLGLYARAALRRGQVTLTLTLALTLALSLSLSLPLSLTLLLALALTLALTLALSLSLSLSLTLALALALTLALTLTLMTP